MAGTFSCRNCQISWANQCFFMPFLSLYISFIHTVFLSPSLNWYRLLSHQTAPDFTIQGTLRSVPLLQHHHQALLHPRSIDPTRHPHSLHSVRLLIPGVAATTAWSFLGQQLGMFMVNGGILMDPPWKSMSVTWKGAISKGKWTISKGKWTSNIFQTWLLRG